MNVKSKMLPLFAGALLAGGALVVPASADPSAIVEDIAATGAQVGFMDYVEPGDVVRLEAGERLVLGYFASCTQETIVGGIVTVGTRESAVSGGTVNRTKISCDSGQVELSSNQANASGVVAFRGGSGGISGGGGAAKPQVILYGLSPLVRARAAGTLVIERLDRAGAPVTVDIAAGATDLAAHNVALAPGGVYRAALTAGGEVHELLFATDAFAQAGDQPKLSRLIRF